ncbi:histidine phosphatase family protein [Shimia sp. R11_0]|uniref:Bifunctional RNase H/acid phosphatase n=1 Tax=Shimia marina TaxID=321267 RepID=A0A0N7LRJ6_9RHOB|nr:MULTISPECIES: histidine phosphatase family protein [Shimia]MBO9478575.1 histidine phosphatase family protein [Shimia sp. R11_0]CUH51004.1 bifunctional RNase H/acid phosphatase [Shimia marina]SFD60573.1 Broad specificity phosphatase PhoE [Shimia marina]
MPHISLVRHGQANTEARDEVSYDRLSDLGHQQAAWLGDHMRDSGEHFQRVFTGSMRRHRETAISMRADRFADIVEDPRLNEFAYFDLSRLMETQFGLEVPTDREGFVRHMPQVLDAWKNGAIQGAPETFDTFEARVRAAMEDIAAGEGRALVVTSGGLIGAVLRQTLNLDVAGWAQMCLAIQNTSVHRWQMVLGKPLLVQFNSVAHLEAPERHHAQTHL